MVEEQEMVSIDKKELVGAAAELMAQGYRLVQIGCTTLADRYEMNYSFDRDYRFKNLRFTVQAGEDVPSISCIYWSAFLYENEIHDLFGIPITNIVIDYRGTLYRTRIPSPFGLTEKPAGGEDGGEEILKVSAPSKDAEKN
jgi:ech hydrogenase subunit D